MNKLQTEQLHLQWLPRVLLRQAQKSNTLCSENAPRAIRKDFTGNKTKRYKPRYTNFYIVNEQFLSLITHSSPTLLIKSVIEFSNEGL